MAHPAMTLAIASRTVPPWSESKAKGNSLSPTCTASPCPGGRWMRSMRSSTAGNPAGLLAWHDWRLCRPAGTSRAGHEPNHPYMHGMKAIRRAAVVTPVDRIEYVDGVFCLHEFQNLSKSFIPNELLSFISPWFPRRFPHRERESTAPSEPSTDRTASHLAHRPAAVQHQRLAEDLPRDPPH